MCAELDPLSHFKILQMEIFGFSQKETGAEECCHGNDIVGEEHCPNISGDILD